MQACSNSSFQHSRFRVGIKNVADYSPFGVQLDGRTISTTEYRIGFQNQEKDDEIKGAGNSVNYKYRMHDPRVGRFFAVDPLTKKYPHNGPYNFSENMVIHAVELEGLESEIIITNESKNKEIEKTFLSGSNNAALEGLYLAVRALYNGDAQLNNDPKNKGFVINNSKGEIIYSAYNNADYADKDDVADYYNSLVEIGEIDIKIEALKEENESLLKEEKKVLKTIKKADELGLDRSEPGDPSIGVKLGHIKTQARRNGYRLELIKKQNENNDKIETLRDRKTELIEKIE